MNKWLKGLALLGLVSMVGGCMPESDKPQVTLPRCGKVNYEIVHLDGCEYIYLIRGETYILTHKGDCKNPMHAYRLEKQEVVESTSTNQPAYKFGDTFAQTLVVLTIINGQQFFNTNSLTMRCDKDGDGFKLTNID